MSPIAQLHEREALGLKSTQAIEPAQGKEKERLESDCKKYLQDPERASIFDFSNFVSNMVRLIGGRSEKYENGSKLNYSKQFTDNQNETSISFRFSEGRIRQSFLTIESKEISEHLFVTSPLQDYNWAVKFISPSPEFKSHITGKKEPTQLTAFRENLEEQEVKTIAQKVFDVYKRQGQQPQPPIPQN